MRNCTYQGSRVFNVPEEKRSDVNIAVHKAAYQPKEN